MEKEMSTLLESAALFEVNVPDFKQLKQCRKEIKLLKTLWDYVIMVRSSIDDWKTTPWKEINVEQMDMDCKKFAKDIRYLIYTVSPGTCRKKQTNNKKGISL